MTERENEVHVAVRDKDGQGVVGLQRGRRSLKDDKSRCSVIKSLPYPTGRSLKLFSDNNAHYGQCPKSVFKESYSFLLAHRILIAFSSK